jgi:hypothetical protein
MGPWYSCGAWRFCWMAEGCGPALLDTLGRPQAGHSGQLGAQAGFFHPLSFPRAVLKPDRYSPVSGVLAPKNPWSSLDTLTGSLHNKVAKIWVTQTVAIHHAGCCKHRPRLQPMERAVGL